jgi:hypothetical protein
MHCKELLELAAVVAIRCAPFLQTFEALPTTGLERYWAGSRCRFDRWAAAMKSYQLVTQGQLAGRELQDSWAQLRPTIEEILTSEVLTRVWGALLCEHDEIRGCNESAPVARSVFVGHQEARSRALKILMHSRGALPDELISLNRLRRQCERWTDVLLSFVAVYAGCAQNFSFDERAIEEQRRRGMEDPAIQEGLTATMRASFNGQLSDNRANSGLNEQIASGVLCCLNANLFVGNGSIVSPWLRRLYNTAEETGGWIQSLLDQEFDQDINFLRRM